jgi:hypothetical protein
MNMRIVPVAVAVLSLFLSSSAFAQQRKTVKECQDEWRAAKADFQAKKITEGAYVTQCRAGTAAKPTETPAPKPAAQTPAAQTPTTQIPAAPAPEQPKQRRAKAPAPTPAAVTPSGEGQFTTEAAAKGHCPGDLVVWANLPTKVYHFAGAKNYGTTKRGAYMCEKEATAQGMRASKTEKRPGA